MSNRFAETRRLRRARGLLARGAVLAALSVAMVTPRLAAQVGYDPAHSPFEDVGTHQAVTTFVSAFLGNRGHAGTGLQSGLAVGGRFATALSGTIELWGTVASISSKRAVLDPSLPESTRVTGTQDLRLVSADLGIALRLTGNKTWHGLAPYVGVAFGVVSPTSEQTDPGGFRVSSNITMVPTIGTRARIGRLLWLTVEARDNLIRYEWPSKYFFPTDANGNLITPPVLNPATEKDTQTTHNFTLTAGLSLHFNF